MPSPRPEHAPLPGTKNPWRQPDYAFAYGLRRLRAIPGIWRLAEVMRGICARRWAGTEGAQVIIRDFDGNLRFLLDRSTHIGSAVYWHGHHSGAELRVLDQLLRPDMVFLDVGANQGEFTVFAAKRLRYGRVLCFEPSPRLFEHLLLNIAINGFENVSAFQLALAQREGEGRLYVPAGDDVAGANEGLASLVEGSGRDPAEMVALRRLDSVVRDEALSRLDILKVDVEGGEMAVLKGAEESLTQFQPTLMIELSEDNCRAAGLSAHDLVQFLVERGYELSAVLPDGTLRSIVASSLPSFANLICRPKRAAEHSPHAVDC